MDDTVVLLDRRDVEKAFQLFAAADAGPALPAAVALVAAVPEAWVWLKPEAGPPVKAPVAEAGEVAPRAERLTLRLGLPVPAELPPNGVTAPERGSRIVVAVPPAPGDGICKAEAGLPPSAGKASACVSVKLALSVEALPFRCLGTPGAPLKDDADVSGGVPEATGAAELLPVSVATVVAAPLATPDTEAAGADVSPGADDDDALLRVTGAVCV